MDTKENIINTKKNKHLSLQERCFIEIRLKEGWSAYKISKSINRAINTVLNEIKRGSVKQIKNGEEITRYFADVGERVYAQNRENCKGKYKFLKCSEFIDYVTNKVLKDNWSLDACVGEAIASARFNRKEMVCTKTLYNNIVRVNRRKLGRSIEERDKKIETREEFGHWEIDTVEGLKDKKDNVLLTLIERKTLNSIHRKIEAKTAEAVDKALESIKDEFGSKFSEVFKTITSDNGSEFSNLSNIENDCSTKVYFTHPYSSFEKGCNERHNGLIRRFIPKGKAIFQYTIDEISRIEDWINTLRRKLNYKTPEALFNQYLDAIYSI